MHLNKWQELVITEDGVFEFQLHMCGRMWTAAKGIGQKPAQHCQPEQLGHLLMGLMPGPMVLPASL
jgi:hypothetical protein